VCALARTCLFPRLERREKVEMGACASVHKDPGHPKKQFLDSPTKAKAANGKGGGAAVLLRLVMASVISSPRSTLRLSSCGQSLTPRTRILVARMKCSSNLEPG